MTGWSVGKRQTANDNTHTRTQNTESKTSRRANHKLLASVIILVSIYYSSNKWPSIIRCRSLFALAINADNYAAYIKIARVQHDQRKLQTRSVCASEFYGHGSLTHRHRTIKCVRFAVGGIVLGARRNQRQRFTSMGSISIPDWPCVARFSDIIRSGGERIAWPATWPCQHR